MMEGLSQTLVWQGLDPTTACANAQAFPTDGTNCKDSICNNPKLILGSHVKSSNNKICREWVERLGLDHRTVVSHSFHGKRTRMNPAYLTRLFSGTAWVAPILRPRPRSFLILWFFFFRAPWSGRRFVPHFLNCLSFLFILAFTLPPISTCRFNFPGLILILLAHPESLGVIVKVEEYGEEHGPVRHKVLYCSIGSLLLGPLLHCARPFF